MHSSACTHQHALRSKVLRHCTLPLTGARCVSMLITELGVFDVAPDGSGLTLREIAPGVDLASVRAATDADFGVIDGLSLMKGAMYPDSISLESSHK
jgi:acyl CoA:acetate/3-ketoacid CoA transferase beta subunit